MKALTYIERGRIDTTPLITHRYKLEDIEEAYRLYEGKRVGHQGGGGAVNMVLLRSCS